MRALLVAGVAALACGCGTDVEPPGTDPTPVAQTTWYQDVAPIVSAHCMSCHQPGGIAPFSLTTYDDVAPIAHMLTDAIDAGEMPPFSEATSADCAPAHAWKGDPRLTAAERATLQAWIDGGGAAGVLAPIAIPAVPD